MELFEMFTKLESSYSILKYLKGEYGEDDIDIFYWDKKIDELKTKSIKDIPKILIKQKMKKQKISLIDKEKLKYIYNTFSSGFKNIFEFKENETLTELCDRLRYNIYMKSYAGEWNNKEETKKLLVRT